jgi:hypothetical protein
LPAVGGAATPVTAPDDVYDACGLADGRWVVLTRGPPVRLVVMRDDLPEAEHPVEDSLAPGVSRIYLTGCSP